MCPYYKNIEVFNDFNEIVVALGGQPMTEEEFKSKELRHKREGVNYAAMEGAYRLWHFNNGNKLDYAPNGALSKLFSDLLEFVGDRSEAIRLKSEVYSDEFKNWFGDWISDSENASKVVDENGEPLIVYHHTNDDDLLRFSTKHNNYFAKDGGTKKAIFFDEEKTGTLNRKYDLLVFLNIRDLREYHETKQQLHDRGTTYRQIVNESAENNEFVGGVHMSNFDDNGKENQSIWIAHNSNQVRPATKSTLKNPYQPPTTRVGEFGTQNDLMTQEDDYSKLYEPPVIYKSDISTEDDLMMSQEDEKTIRDTVDKVSPARPHTVYNSDGDIKVQFSVLSKDHLRTTVKRALKEAGFKLGKIIYAGDKVRAVVTKIQPKQKAVQKTEPTRLQFYKGDRALLEQELTEERWDRKYEKPNTEFVDLSTESDLMASLDDSRQEYENTISDKLLSAMNLLYNSYQKNVGKSTTARENSKSRVFELMNELKRLRNDAAEEALSSVLNWGIVVLGETNNNDKRTVYGFLKEMYEQSDGEFTNVTPNQLYDIYKNTIGFFENTLVPLLPKEYDGWFSDDIYRRIDIIQKSLAASKSLWAKATREVTIRYINDFIDNEVTQSLEIKDNMKRVAEDWLTLNMYYGDINTFSMYVANFGLQNNPIIKIAFHVIQYAETQTLSTMHTLATPLAKAYKRADSIFRSGAYKRYLSSSWQEIFMEKDRDGIPTGNFVRDINYGQYELDLNDFVEQLNDKWDRDYGYHYVEDEYGYTVDTLNRFHVEEQQWIDNGNGDMIPPNWYLYLAEIERWKDSHCGRRFNLDYYLERMSVPYRGYEDPVYTRSDLKGHGLSPKTLIKYRNIQSNINNYLSMCRDENTGIAYPHKLSPNNRANLKYWEDKMEDLSNPYTSTGELKETEERIMAFEIRAWQKFIGQHTTNLVQWSLYDEALENVKNYALKNNDPRVVDDFIQMNTRWGINPDYFSKKAYPVDDDLDVIHARLLKSSLESLIKTDAGYTKNLSIMENNPEYWIQYQRKEQIIADRRKRKMANVDFAKKFDEHFVVKPILYRDARGYYYSKTGAQLTSILGISERSLMTYADYLIEKYASDIVAGGTLTRGIIINEMYDANGQLKSKDEIKKLLEDFVFSYIDEIHQPDGSTKEVQKLIGALTITMPRHKTFKNPNTGRIEETIIRVPKGSFAEKQNAYGELINDSGTYNPEDKHPELPLRSRYDNSKALNDIYKDPALKNLYEQLIHVMEISYKKHAPEKSLFDYRLPRINAANGAIVSRMIKNGFTHTFDYIIESMTEVQPNDSGMISSNERIKNPDGSIGHSLPLKYVGKLKDRRTYTSDIVGAVIAYAHMAENYKNKLMIESILNLIDANLDDSVRDESSKRTERGKTSRSKQVIDALLNSSLYENRYSLGELETKETKKQVTLSEILKNIIYTGISMGLFSAGIGFAINPILYGAGGFVIGGILGGLSSFSGGVASKKMAYVILRSESLQMLGSNILSMAVGIGDASIKMVREAITFKHMTIRDLASGLTYAILHLPLIIQNISNPIPNCKIVAMMLMNGVSKDTKRIFGSMNKGRIRKVLNNLCLGGFSMLDYFTNCVLLKAHYSNIRFYNGNSIPKGYYTYREMKQAFIDKGSEHPGWDAKIAFMSCFETLWDAYQFNGGTLDGKIKGALDGGMVSLRPDRAGYVKNKHVVQVRTKTIQRGALYNGMNPDNDIPLYKRTLVGAAIGAMRGWLTQQMQHLFYGLDDTSVREFEDNTEEQIVNGKTKLKSSRSMKPRTDLQRAQRMTWNYETGAPQDEILNGIWRSFDTLWNKIVAAIPWTKKKLKDIKFSYVEKYAWRDVLVTLGILYQLLIGWPKYHDSVKNIPMPQNRQEAGPTGITDVPRYMRDIYIGKGVYKLTLDDIYFRSIESLLTGIDPKTMSDVVNALSVYKSGVEELLGILETIADVSGVSGHSLDEVIKKGSYKYYTRGERRFYKTYSLGLLDNLHTAFSYNGLWLNLNFYYKQYGWIYKAFGYNDFKAQQEVKKSSGKRHGHKRGSRSRGRKRGKRSE